MIRESLGTPIDIHGGGQDLRFPHHENEIAQSCCAHDTDGAPLARFWLHNGFLNMGKDKMSKSLGNIVTPHELLETWDGEVLRFALMSAQYRQPLEWTEALLAQSKKQLERFYRTLNDLADIPVVQTDVPESVLTALNDDLNTPEAIAALHGLREEATRAAGEERATAKGRLLAAGRLLGLLDQDPAEFLKGRAGTGDLDDAAIEALLAERAAARAARNWGRADEIRDQLGQAGIVFEDGPDGTTWRRS